MSTLRGIDHLVIAVNDLSAARDRFSRFGFCTTPLGRQPWGTANHIVQFPGHFIELVGDDTTGNALDIGSLTTIQGTGITFNGGTVAAGDKLTIETTEDAVRINGAVTLQTDLRIDTDQAW